MSIQEARRAGFEAWYLRRFSPDCDMRSGWAQERWEAWNASLDSQQITLPKPTLMLHLDAQHHYRDLVVESLRAQGFEVTK